MDDADQRAKLEQLELERARAKLTQEQRDYLDRLCDLRLREHDCYAPKHEIAFAKVLSDGRSPIKQNDAIVEIATLAYNEARAREAQEARDVKLKEAERDQGAAAEKLKQQGLQKQEVQKRAAQESARREQIPNTMQRFNAILTASKAQKAQANEAGIERLAERAPYRPNYARHDAVQAASRGEISDAKAKKLNDMFTKPLSDKGFDPTDTPTHTHTNSDGRGSR